MTGLDFFQQTEKLFGNVPGLELEPEPLSLELPLEEHIPAQLEPERWRRHVVHQQLLLRTVFVRWDQVQSSPLNNAISTLYQYDTDLY